MGIFTGVPTSVPEAASKSWVVGMMNGLMSAFGSWTSYTPTLASSAGSITSYTVNQARYMQVGKLVHLHFDVTITNNGTGSGYLSLTAPHTPTLVNTGVGREIATTGNMFIVQAGGSSFDLLRYDNAYPGATGYRLCGSITYEID